MMLHQYPIYIGESPCGIHALFTSLYYPWFICLCSTENTNHIIDSLSSRNILISDFDVSYSRW